VKNKMINKKIAMSAMSIVTVLALTTGATFALFTDTATAEDATFTAGTADLQVGLDTGSEGTVVFADSFPAPDFNNLQPGFTSETDFWVRNNSDTGIDLDVLADLAGLTETPGGDASNDLKNNLMISWNCDTDDDGSLANNTPTAEFSVNDWVTGGNAALGTITANNAIFCRMFARVPETAGNNIQDDSLTFDAVYDATSLEE
jgi:predicted ribosomally synthesized peptide with SipW-like signal peptide